MDGSPLKGRLGLQTPAVSARSRGRFLSFTITVEMAEVHLSGIRSRYSCSGWLIGLRERWQIDLSFKKGDEQMIFTHPISELFVAIISLIRVPT